MARKLAVTGLVQLVRSHEPIVTGPGCILVTRHRRRIAKPIVQAPIVAAFRTCAVSDEAPARPARSREVASPQREHL